MIVLFDLDNTIADMDHRLPMLDEDEVDWDAFEKACKWDKPIQATIEVMQAMADAGHQVWIWTGRSDGVRSESVEWLRANQVPYVQLLMRPHGADLPTSHLKRRWLDDDPIPRRKVLCAFDDDPRIIRMLLEEKVLAFQLKRPEGDA